MHAKLKLNHKSLKDPDGSNNSLIDLTISPNNIFLSGLKIIEFQS
jgi:hypothetical protein